MVKKKISYMLMALLVVTVFMVSVSAGYSQVIVQRSNDKITISGVQYFVHQVKKGETAYSISKAYGITVEELAKENPPAVYGVKEGQSLRIPVNSVSTVTVLEPVTVKNKHDESKYIYHSLKPGETVYFLSKSYGVSENEIIQSNAGIDINKLPVGTEIAVPRRVFMNDRQKFDYQEKKYIYHKVLKGETLSSIAEKYGLSVRELRKQNRDLRFPQVGDFVRIFNNNIVENQPVEQIIPDTIPVAKPEPVLKPERLSGFTPVKDLKGSLNVAVLLPFYLKENSVRSEIDSSVMVKGKKVKKVIKRSEEWIYPRSLDFVEMYEGILLAADTLRSLGLDINLYPFDIKSDTVAVTKLINSGKLASMDLIIGPVYSYNLIQVANYAGSLGIPVVSPVPLINNSALSANPTLFMAISTLEVAQRALAKKISEYNRDNFVFYHSDTTGMDPDVYRFKNLIITELTGEMPYESIRFKELPFYSRSMFDNDSINRLSHSLSEQSENIVIIASEELPVISETMMDVHGLSKRFDVRVFGYPVLRDNDNLDPKYLFDLDVLVYSPYWIDYTKKDVLEFNTDFRQKFLTEPVEKSYSWQGYDIAYYFLSGLALHGKTFIDQPQIHNPDLLQTEYDFVRKEPGSGFENQKLFLVRYTKDYEIKLIEENSVTP